MQATAVFPSQSLQLADDLARQGHPHKVYSHEGLKHYFSTSAESATTQQMFQDLLDWLRMFLADR